VLDWPAVPTTLKFRISNVPDPTKDPPWNAEMIRCPAFAPFGVIDIPLLSVPVCVKAGEAGWITAGLKSTFRS